MESRLLAFLSRAPILKGVLFAILLQSIAVFLLVNLFHFTGLSDRHLDTFISVTVFLGVVGGGILAAKAAEARYLFQGLGVGVACFLAVVILSLLSGVALEMVSIGKKALTYVGAGLMGGFLGALLGK
ncbi:MAG TPA: TIGR04086 family membrane protein [Clostridia bacterium]|nr:TIGR04086 family membrane protein [Clostridia bacterium]